MASGALACPVASCPFQPMILASAFAQGTFATGPMAANTLAAMGYPGTPAQMPYSTTYGNDSYPYLAQTTVQNEHLLFPPYLNAQGATTQNFNAISLHTYGALWDVM